ncbi:MAG: triose-phosphate isomerase [Bacteroidia bacterium]
MRKKIVAGNWKMNKTRHEAIDLVKKIGKAIQTDNITSVNTIVAPPFPFLSEISAVTLAVPALQAAAQNCHYEESGAYTGEVSAAMLKSVGAEHVIIGHSERRQYFQENDAMLLAKTRKALEHQLGVIFCIGELLEQRENGSHFTILEAQLRNTVFQLSESDFSKIVIAYEPVWAIGTGVTASPAQAEEVHAFIRGLIADVHDLTVAESTSIIYGGSCNPSNAAELFSCANIDGGLIGGASLKADDFLAIRKAMIEVLA